MIILEAPYPLVSTVLVLPNPFLNDVHQPQNLINLQRAMDGTIYTNVKRTPRRLYTFDFETSRIKSLEFFEFCRLYLGNKWRLTWDNLIVIGYCATSPVTLNKIKSDADCTNGFDRVQFNLQFDGVPQ